MKKVVCSILLFILVINFALCNNSYATGWGLSDPLADQTKSPYLNSVETSNTATEDLINSGKTSMKSGSSSSAEMNQFAAGTSGVGTITGIIARIINVLFAMQIDTIMGILTNNEESTNTSGGNDTVFFFTIDRCIFNRVALFDINYFDTDDYVVGSGANETTIKASTANTNLKESVSKTYYICRIVALVLSLLVLIYIGIRMAISTIASDRAKYKKMLISWVESIIVLFVMLYLMWFIILVGQKLTNIFYDIRCQILGSNEDVFEDIIRDQAWSSLFEKSGFDLTIWSIIYWCLLILELKFFTMYIRRFLMVGLLIAISPLIIITFSIDKAGDGRAQAFNTWMQEFVISVLIQPLHALIYLVFVFTANKIASSSPLFALALLLSMTVVENMVRVIFGVKASEIIRQIKFLKRGGK